MGLYKLKFLFLIPLLGAMVACTDNNDPEPEPPGPTPNPSTEEKFEDLISEMEDIDDLDTFTNMFKALDTEDWEDVEELTLFAFTNKATTRMEASPAPQELMERHIVKGKYTLDDLKKISILYSINGSALKILVDADGNVSVNGVTLGKATIVDGYAIYPIEEILPEVEVVEPSQPYVFQVYEYIDDNGDGQLRKEVVPNAEVVFYDEYMNPLDTIYTDANGKATLSEAPGNRAGYIVTNPENNSSNLFNGWLVIGVFETQEQIDNYAPYYEDKYIGGPMFADLNEDNVIDVNDHTTMAWLGEEYDIEVYLVELETSTEDVMESMRQHFYSIQELYREIDQNLYLEIQRQNINVHDIRLQEFYTKAYSYIYMVNAFQFLDPYIYELLPEELWECHAYRARTYLYLTQIFGDVPLRFDQDGMELPSRTPVTEVIQFIEKELNEANQFVTTEIRAGFAEDQILLYLGEKKYADAINVAKLVMETSTTDIQLPAAIPLYLAEAYLIMGNIQEALTWVNTFNTHHNLPEIDASHPDILKYMKPLYNTYKIGYNIPNYTRWGEMDSWKSKYRLLPIPHSEIEKNPNLTQNPGW